MAAVADSKKNALRVRNTRLLLTSPSTVLFEKLGVAQPARKSLAFYGTRWFITVCTGAHKPVLFWARWFQSTTIWPVSLIKASLIKQHPMNTYGAVEV
jgi:hypothetical protein